MQKTPPPNQQIDRTLALGLLILLLFSTPIMMWWTTPGSPWYLPYLLWLGVIIIIAWMNHKPRIRSDS
ncbi:MAG: UTP--glucose-1-phosphate uridylyltransferase [Candidatus Thiodiazotropha sp.]